jgi:hypothetical protein
VKRIRQAVFAALLLLSLPPAARAASSMICNGSIISMGTQKVDLLGKCGEPTQSDVQVEERVGLSGSNDSNSAITTEKRVSVTVEHWVYDLGSDRFVRTVTLENGKVVGIAEGAYGHAKSGEPKPSKIAVAPCDPLHAFTLGTTSLEVLSRCGEPVSREQKQIEIRTVTQDASGNLSGLGSLVQVEVWSYNFGAQSFTRLLHFRDGKLVKVATGGYGFGG